jgi:hypothetical protein
VHRIIINKRTLTLDLRQIIRGSDDKILNLKEGQSTLNQVQIYTVVTSKYCTIRSRIYSKCACLS